MKYTVLIDPKVKEAITAFALPRQVLVRVYEKLLQELPSNPDKFLTEKIIPRSWFAYPIAVADQASYPYRFAFVFAVDRRNDVKQLHVVSVRLATDSPDSTDN